MIRARSSIAIGATALALCGMTDTSPVTAQDRVSLAGKTVTMTIGNAAGGSSDLYGRVVGRYLVEHLPGKPNLVVVNQPGAEGVVALNSWVVRAARDGTAITLGAGTQTNPLYYRAAQAKYDLKQFKFIGGVAAPGGGLFIDKKVLDRLYDKSKPPVVMGALSAIRGNMYMNLWGGEFLGWNSKWVVGYPNTTQLNEALQRGEIDMSSFGSLTEINKLIATGKFTVVAQQGRMEHGKMASRPVFGDTPIFADIIAGKISDPLGHAAYDYWERIGSVGQWLSLPPDTPEPIAAIHRAALIETFKDPAYVEQAAKIVTDGEYMSAEDLEKLVRDLDQTPQEVFEYLRQLQRKVGFTQME